MRYRVGFVVCIGLLAAALAVPWVIRGGTQRAVEEGLEGLRSESFGERERSARRLRSLGEPARKALEAALTDPDPDLRLRAAEVLRALDRDREPFEVTRHREFSRVIRHGLERPGDLRPGTTRYGLLALDPTAAARAGVAVARTVERDPLLLQRAVILLRDLGRPEAAPYLSELLTHGWLLPSTLYHVSEGLRAFGGPAERARVREAMISKDPESRRYSIRTLAILGSAEDLALLRRAARDAEERVRREVPDALTRIGAEAAVPDLMTLAGDRAPQVRSAALFAMIPLPSAPVRRLAVRSLGDEAPEVRATALRALRARGNENDEAKARALLADPSPRVRGEAILTVAALGRPEVAVFHSLTDDSPAVRRVALLTARDLPEADRARARELLEDEADPYLARLRDHVLGRPSAD
ncbi:MAG: HEAT repeat domain-containing protein [Planctomycetota bacterium]